MADRAASPRRVDLPAVFGDRGLYLLVDPPARAPGGVDVPVEVGTARAFGLAPDARAGEEYQLVHVISGWVKGEVRGYAVHRGELRLRRPCFTGEWPQMDAAVRQALGLSEPAEVAGA